MSTSIIGFSTGAKLALREFRSHIGPNEDPPGSNRTWYGKRYGWDGVYYCVQAIWAVLDVTGSTAAIKKTASTGVLYNWAKAVGRTRSTPQPGDIIIVTKNGATKHVDMVESYKNGRLIAIGANTSNGFGSTDNGGGTYRNDRTAWLRKGLGSRNGWAIKTFVRPFYGLTTETVERVQRKAGLKVDGQFGPGTLNATKRLQRAVGLTADGFPGPKFVEAVLDGGRPAPAPSSKSKPVSEDLDVDGKLGVATAKRIQKWLGVKQDGKIGPATIRAWQKAHGTPVDGKITGQGSAAKPACPAIRSDCLVEGKGGSKLIRKVQLAIGLKGDDADGKLGPDTVKALQRHYNRVG